MEVAYTHNVDMMMLGSAIGKRFGKNVGVASFSRTTCQYQDIHN